jgi:hypothetical protein
MWLGPVCGNDPRTGVASTSQRSYDVVVVDLNADTSVATVVFTCSEGVAAELNVATGPCVARGVGEQPLTSPLRQNEGDRLENWADLYSVLTEQSGGAWSDVKQDGRGVLATFSDTFSQALASLRDSDSAEQLETKSRQWLQGSGWRNDMQVGGVRTRLAVASGWAHESVDRRQPLYCWAGPAVPTHVLVGGPSETYDAYRRTNQPRS